MIWRRSDCGKRLYYALLHCICACGVTVGENLLLHFLVLDRLRTPVTVEADVLNSLIVFYNWFCKRATAEADFLGSCRKYILLLISIVSCWRSTEVFFFLYIFFFKYFNIDLISNWLLSQVTTKSNLLWYTLSFCEEVHHLVYRYNTEK